MPTVHEAAGNGKFQNRLGRDCEPLRGAAGDVDRGQPKRIYAARYRAVDGRRPRRVGGMRLTQRADRCRMRRRSRRVRAGGGIHGHAGAATLPASSFGLHGRKTSRHRESDVSCAATPFTRTMNFPAIQSAGNIGRSSAASGNQIYKSLPFSFTILPVRKIFSGQTSLFCLCSCRA